MKNKTTTNQKQETVFFNRIVFEYPQDYFGQRHTDKVRCVNFEIKNIPMSKLKPILKELTLIVDSAEREYATIESGEPKLNGKKLTKKELRERELESSKQRVKRLEEVNKRVK